MDLLLFTAILSLLVFVHEAGHFFVARRAGIRVLEFGFGLPPRLIGKKVGETIYSLNLLPIGGFVRLFGEEAEDVEQIKKIEGTEELRKVAFFTQPKRIRLAVLSAGVIMNFLLGILLFSGLYSVLGIPTPIDKVQVIGIAPESPAHDAFELEDVIIAVGGEEVLLTDEFKSLVEAQVGEEVTFLVDRGGEHIETVALPRRDPPEGQGSLGVVIAPKIEFVHYPIWQMPFRGVRFGMGEALNWGMSILSGLWLMIVNVFSGRIPRDIGGPFEIYFLVREVANVGLTPLIQLVGVLSVNLAIINLLPIPALDGGRLMFVILEAVIGKRVNARVERMTHAVGMAFLLALLLAITVQDIVRRFDLSSLRGLFERPV